VGYSIKRGLFVLLGDKESIPPEEWDLLRMVLDFADGALFRKAKVLNGECPDNPFLEEKI
jgi:hypothetical protein